MRTISRWAPAAALLLAMAALCRRDLTAGEHAEPNSGRQTVGVEGNAALRLREGAAVIEQSGAFQMVGDRLVFVFDSEGRQMIALENLALERVVRAVRQNPSRQTWIVTGTVTEYLGNNYLLVERAIIRRPNNK